jgi:hypothetical protein
MINEGSFESLDVGMVDTTVNVLDLPGGLRLFVDRRPLREGATPRDLARSRTDHEARAQAKFTVLREGLGEVGSLPVYHVAAYFLEDAELVYQRRAHFIQYRTAFVLTLRGPMPAREGVDASLDQVLGTLVFRPDP